MKLKPKELRRQILHFLYGPVLIALHYFSANPHYLLALLGIGILASYWVKSKQKKNWISKITAFLERKSHLKSFPGQGPLFFTLGAYLSLLLFKTEVAYAAIMILSVGDAVSHLIGRCFGKIKTPLHPEKYIEGSVVAFLLSVPFAFAFFPHLWAVILASLAAMLMELPDFKLWGWNVDDNLIIPLVAGGVLTFFA